MSTGFVLNIPQEMLNRLEDADKKIEKLAKTSEDAQVRIVSAFKSMTTNGVDAFIQRLDVAQQKLAALGGTQINMGVNANTSGFQQLIDAINNLSQASKTNITINGLGTVGNQTQTAIDAINKLMATLQQLQQMGGQQFLGGVNNLSRQTLREMNKEARKMQKTMQDLDDAIQKYGISATDLANKLQQARQAQQQFNEAAKQQAQADVSGLVNQKGQQRTLNELKNYANELKRTMANLDPKSQEWAKLNNIYKQTNREIKNIQNSMKDVQKQSRSLMDVSGQLARRLALVFSVSQITGYVKKLIEVRGEFELQQRSLQAILQNKDEANRIWQQTVDLAVRSPFRVKELVSYTKQLAAYRIESDKLFETNKMLADISAGLGVDMQRLILAFGQVRSAAYLRGTELRQFTEAGIPILEQLAQYFTELEGRAVSVGDVFERVSKRMVSFADVEEIFKRMTSEGGTFYRMQEIQAETLQGQISNLKDSVDIMLNEIGKANEATLKNSVAMVRNFVENWEEAAAVIGHVLKILSPLLATMALVKLGSSSLGKTVVSVATGLWNFAGSVEKVGLGMTGLSIKTAVATKAVQTLKTALIGLGSGVATVALSAFVYWCLEVWRKSTEAERSIKKLNGALEEIYTQDTSTLKTQIRGFENLVGRLKEANENTRERREIISQINSQYGEYLGFIVDEKTSYEQLANSIDSVTLALTRRAKATSFEKALAEVYGKTNETIAESEKVLRDTMDDIFGTQVDGKALSLLPNEEEIIKIFDLIDKKTIELGRPLESSEIREVLEGFYGYFVSFNTTKKEAADFMSAIEKRGQAVLTQREKELEIDRRINEVYKDNAESAAEATKAFKELEERRTAALSDAKGAPKWQVEKIKRDFEIEKIDLQVKYEGLDKATADLRKKTLESMNATVNDINKKIEGSISKLGEKYANLIYIDETEAATGVNQIAENTAAAYKAQKEILKQQNSLKEAGTAYDADILKNAQKSADAYYYKLQLLGRLDLLQKETAKEERKEMKLLRQQLAALKEAGQTYQNLRKDFDMTTATQKTASAFKDLFAELEMTDLTKGMSFDELGILKVLEELPNNAGDAGKKAIEKLRAEFLSERDVKAQRKRSKLLLASIQEEFDRYDLSLELKKLNIPPDLAKSLFDVDYLDLEGLKKAVEGRSAAFIGTDMEDEYKKFLDKIDDLEEKQQKESAKRFVKFLTKNLNQTRVVLEQKGIDISFAKEQFDNGAISAETFAEVVREISKQANDDISKINFEKFKESSLYIKAMGDLAAYSKKELDNLANELSKILEENAKNMKPDELEAYHKALERIREETRKFNPFIGENEVSKIVEYLSLEKELTKERKKQKELEEEKAKLENKRTSLIDLLDKARQQQAQGKLVDTGTLENQLINTEESIEQVDSLLSNSEMKISNISGQIGNIAGGAMGAIAMIDMIVQAVNDTCNAAKKTFEDIMEMADSFGVETDKGSWREASMFFEGMSNFNAEVTEGWENLKSGNLMGAIANTIGSIVGFIRDVNKWKDSNAEEFIQSQLEEVERLEKEYEKLEWVIDRAFSFDKYGKVAEQTKNLGQQIDNLQSAIAAEEDKKDTDPERIKELKENIEETSRQIQELYDNLRADIVGTFEDLSTTLGEAMISALQQGEDAIAAWGEEVDNIIQDIVGKLLIQKFLEPKIADLVDSYYAQIMPKSAIAEKKYQEYLDAMDSGDSNKADRLLEEYLKLNEQAINEVPKISEDATKQFHEGLNETGDWFLNIIPDWLKEMISSSQGGGLSALQKGIQGVTEETAQVIEALLNSMRFYVADSNAKLTQLLNNMMEGETESPMLAELRAQTKWMRDIYNLINGMTATHPSGGRGIKTVM